MGKKILSAFIVLTSVMLYSAPIYAEKAATSTETSQYTQMLNVVKKIENINGEKIKFQQNNGQVFIAGKLSKKKVPSEKEATQFLEDNKQIFGIDSAQNELKPISTKKDSNGDTFVRFNQVINGVSVKDRILNVHFDKNGTVVSVNGTIEKNKTVTRLGNISINEEDAVNIALKQFTYKTLENTPKAIKTILTDNNKNYEVFKVNIYYTNPTIGNWDVFVDISSGKVIKTENNIKYDGKVLGTGIDVSGTTRTLNLYQSGSSYQMKDISNSAASYINTYSYNNTTLLGTLVSNSTSNFNQESHKAAVSAHYNAGKVINFYKNLFNRNSLDNNSMAIKSYTHYGKNYNNAFWDGQEMIYGDGDGLNFTYLSGDLDVVGHEMTHGVIENTANLNYDNEQGALNESIADTFGVLIETYTKYNVAAGGTWQINPSDWVIGDDIYTPQIKGDALRSLVNPALYDQPDNMSGYENLPDNEAGDFGGVHTNSGITNKAAYLIAQSIGMEKTARIYYRALVNYMTPTTDFNEARNVLVESAVDLYGGGSAEVAAVNNAFDTVGIGQNLAVATPSVIYEAHVQNIGWQNYVKDGALAGTEGQGLRVEAFKINLNNAPAGLNIKYKTQVQNIGWQSWVYNGALAGTEGQGLRVEAIQIMLEGTDADKYSVEYEVHVQNEGWQPWFRDGQTAGTVGKSERIEAIKIKITEKPPMVSYQSHVQNVGWQNYVQDGAVSGTEGQGLRVEALKINLNNTPVGLNIKYKTQVQNIGWQDWIYNGALTGTEGKGLRIESLQIMLEGTGADKYSILYQAEVQNQGWQNWVKDGETAGTVGKSLRIEAMKIIIIEK
ncbi:Zn-dependent metalloprotease [Clostridium acetobutylicum]|uniref:Extracellular neutral metalloprotease, NPRE, fused to ChW-repeats n=1 Tax=Clostridium acetobutylicum (strain ATCC 824 / DSM 792 / JCM 1419 / IAM 19013 / LMG 5710 / NBRC 13948 / NRRL B-527 / VKM B-1787 / 2291 / W) TaxID=272562 RepID=Q97GS5_CLOAB|nr:MULTISPECIES: M4 family metallopeptidase [Clostridium]AAK80247.1 Extracellular neutral metalloprotease, NPRE, fused to ChW-repeats [Clostridium acetobutylicum ATCC 824]AEI34298.1 ChW repeat-containing metalloprotease [Clostridium acetobutylicum DSM 1731]AWV79329.1 peptidase M4 [Clostridium acetobutylicum]MBC2394700.1 peptidase M4 [Clostridium acetobutylicum]MBC2585659.1 peptidase M4 [Clostridium acetobutylicum]